MHHVGSADAAEERQEQEGNFCQYPDRNCSGQATKTGRSDRTEQGQGWQKAQEEGTKETRTSV